MKFHFEYSVALPVPLDLAFYIFTSVEHLSRVIALSDLVCDFEIISIEGHVVHFRFHETIPAMFNFFQGKLPVVVKQTVDADERMLTFESSVYEDMITVLKKRMFTELDSNTTKITETVDGQCSFVYARIAQQQGEAALRQHMNAYRTLFVTESEQDSDTNNAETNEENPSNNVDN
jgi:hypothetical protein